MRARGGGPGVRPFQIKMCPSGVMAVQNARISSATVANMIHLFEYMFHLFPALYGW
jgi:hypothetical protein